ncbi:MAG: DUF2147 domain-containing protein [Flavobacteriaceae bacterium]|nr:DUF2147 domain-containing protein [Flavobacteriaceae bacterium]|tara:strand:+ start:1487 stop:1879 length:393 start_codon:yes stop_codon:yes gene_type:complete
MLWTFFFQTDSIEGTWITTDDETGNQKSEVLIFKENGKLYGKITKLLLPEDQGKKCINCKGKNKDQSIVGMLIINDLQLDDYSWEDGTILDPKSGKVYDCNIGFEDSNTLKVRGYIGFSLLGRTQIWKRK